MAETNNLGEVVEAAAAGGGAGSSPPWPRWPCPAASPRPGVALDIPKDGIVAGLTAATRETGLRNLANPNVPESLAVAHDGLAVDHNSVAILAQTPWWGPA